MALESWHLGVEDGGRQGRRLGWMGWEEPSPICVILKSVISFFFLNNFIYLFERVCMSRGEGQREKQTPC